MVIYASSHIHRSPSQKATRAADFGHSLVLLPICLPESRSAAAHVQRAVAKGLLSTFLQLQCLAELPHLCQLYVNTVVGFLDAFFIPCKIQQKSEMSEKIMFYFTTDFKKSVLVLVPFFHTQMNLLQDSSEFKRSLSKILNQKDLRKVFQELTYFFFLFIYFADF